MTKAAVELRRSRIEGEIFGLDHALSIIKTSRSFGPCNLDGIEHALRFLRETAEKRLAELGE